LLVRELVLQLKTGRIDAGYFRRKFAADVLAEWRDVWDHYVEQGWVEIDEPQVRVTPEGLLRVDSLLPSFFEPEHQNVRYT
jgi:oxygen-independent coproporphyrinogen-3 oxidase